MGSQEAQHYKYLMFIKTTMSKKHEQNQRLINLYMHAENAPQRGRRPGHETDRH
jgi:hypothetical protein